VAEVLSAGLDVDAIRDRFSSLRQGFAFLDAPGGTQVPDEVGDAIARALRESSANLGAGYATSIRVGQILEEAEGKAARFLGCEPREVTFGANMTTLNFALSRTAAREFRAGDEILVSCLDHDAGVAPWLEIAHDRDLVVRQVALHDDTTLEVGDLEDKLGPRTQVVAFAWASNAVGTVTDAARVCQLAHDAGALAWVDAVHYAAHEPIDVRQVGADVLICSPYKFFGPHLGALYGKRGHLRRLRPYKVRPSTDQAPDRWESGTQVHELIAGIGAAVEYMATLGRRSDRTVKTRREALVAAYRTTVAYERRLVSRLIDGLQVIPGVRLYGITDPSRFGERCATLSLRIGNHHPTKVATFLGERGIFTWDGNYYALNLTERLGVESQGGLLRIGLVHYNTLEEVERLLAALREFAAR